MRVLLFGSNGMLGQAVKEQLAGEEDIELFCAARSGADFCLDFTDDNAVAACFTAARPDAIINAAAEVSLPKCDESPALAYLVNSRFCSVLAEQCRGTGSYLVQVSTDHYYVGDGDKKHGEEFPIILLNEYARTKYAGECLVRAYSHSVVLRTNIIGFRGIKERPTFLEWAVGALESDAEITAFTDFYTSPIHVRQFADILTGILQLRPEGIYNLASAEVISKAYFLEKLSQKLFQKPLAARLGSVHDMPGIKRADSLGLATDKLEALLGYQMPSADEVIESVYQEYMRRKE